MTLRAIEIVESCLNFFADAMKTIRRSRMFASQAPQTRFAKMKTLGIPRIRISAPLSLGMRPLIPRLHCVSPNHRSGDCKMYVNGHNYM